MKKISYLLIILFSPGFIWAQQGKVFDNLSLKSEILKVEKKFSIYLPPDYDHSQRSYPVLYLLHGGGGNNTVWVQNGNVLFTADKMINEGIISPMVIVMPDASSPIRGWSNVPDGSWLPEDYFINELIPYIQKNYRIRPGKQNRAIAGLSGGARATFNYAMHHPELFAAACPLSAGTWPDREAIGERLKKENPGITDAQIDEFYNRYNILENMGSIPENKKNAVRWYIECGDDDLISYEENSNLHILMTKNGIPHEFRVRDGAHDWDFWRSALPSVLEFVNKSFSR